VRVFPTGDAETLVSHWLEEEAKHFGRYLATFDFPQAAMERFIVHDEWKRPLPRDWRRNQRIYISPIQEKVSNGKVPTSFGPLIRDQAASLWMAYEYQADHGLAGKWQKETQVPIGTDKDDLETSMPARDV
jgi:hypothetical protein